MNISVRLPARDLAVAWHNVSLASATDKAAARSLQNTVSVEVYGPSSVRLVAADGALLLTSWVDGESPDPGRNVQPEETFIVADSEGLAKAFMTHLLKATKADGPEQWREVTISFAEASIPDVPTFDGMSKHACTLDTDDHRVQLAVIEAAFPSWRAAWPTPDREAPAERVALAPDYLAVLSKFKEAGSSVRLTFHTGKGPAVIHADGTPPVAGLVVPKALSDDQAEVDQLQAFWDSSAGGS